MVFTIRFLLILAVVFAVLAFAAVFLSQTTYFISCVVVPLALAVGARYSEKWEHGGVSLMTLFSATLVGSMMMAYGSYNQTFMQGKTGLLVGDGWNSVAAAAIVGSLAGLFCGILSLALYFMIVVVVRAQTPSPDTKT